ncbi:MAG: hypothetical protein AAGF11_29700 [Myxococcota bacterium]
MAVAEIKEALRSATSTVSKYMGGVAVLHVETHTVETKTGQEPVLAARTVIALDGDNTAVVPAQQGESGKWEVDSPLYEVHMQNVQSAIEYRAKMVESMLSFLRMMAGGIQ